MKWALEQLFSTAGFPARWVCGRWTPLHGWLHIAADMAVFSAYAAIPVALVYFVRKRRDVPGQQATAVIALIKKQTVGVALVKTEFKLHAILANGESLWRGFAENQLRQCLGRGGAANLARKSFVVYPARGMFFSQPLQLCSLLLGQRAFALRE